MTLSFLWLKNNRESALVELLGKASAYCLGLYESSLILSSQQIIDLT